MTLLLVSVWDAADETVNNVKKALTLLPKLKGKIVNLDEECKVVGYLSGHNKSTFSRYILDGMYAMECEEQKVRSDRKQKYPEIIELQTGHVDGEPQTVPVIGTPETVPIDGTLWS